MNFPPAFLVAAFVLFIANCVQSENDCEISDSEARAKATDAMKNCNSNIKNCYDTHQGKDVEKLYCKGMMNLIRCAFKKARAFADNHDCRSPVLDKWVFVVLQYVTIGYRVDICIGNNSYSQNELKRLKELSDRFDKRPKYEVKSIRRTPILDVDKECARDIHKKCAERLVEPNPNLCTSVSNFVDCYGNFIGGLSPLPSSCIGPVPEITDKFNTVIQEFSTYLIKLYKHDPERMCQVDEKVLEGDCMTMSVE